MSFHERTSGSINRTALRENFSLGLTDPTVNSPCVDGDGLVSGDASLVSRDQCAPASLLENPGFIPGLVPFDLSRGGTPFQFNGRGTINQQAFYVQDSLRLGPATVNLGLRTDHYDGLTTKTLVQPRVGVSYAVPGSGTIVRGSYGRTLETPYTPTPSSRRPARVVCSRSCR